MPARVKRHPQSHPSHSSRAIPQGRDGRLPVAAFSPVSSFFILPSSFSRGRPRPKPAFSLVNFPNLFENRRVSRTIEKTNVFVIKHLLT
jgi:hypothetical protein